MKSRMQKLILSGLVVLMVAALLALGGFAGCAPEEEAVVSEWNISCISALTGPLSWQGSENKRYGYDRAAAEINAAGGIRGVPITFTEYDCGWDPAKAVMVMPRAVESSLVVLGPAASVDLQASGHIAVDEGVFVLAAQCEDNVGELFAPWVQTLNPSIEPAVKHPTTEWLRLSDDITSVAMFYHPEFSSMVATAERVVEAAEAMGVEVQLIEVPAATLDFGPSAVKAIGAGCDGFYVMLIPESAGKQVIELRNRGVTEGRRIILGPALMGPAYIGVAGEALEDTYVTGLQNPDYPGDRYQAILKDYAAENEGSVWPQQSTWSIYDAVYLVKEAFEACEITGDPAKLAEERIAIRDYIKGLHGEKRFQSVRGKDVELIKSGITLPCYLFQLKKDGTAVKIGEWPAGPE